MNVTTSINSTQSAMMPNQSASISSSGQSTEEVKSSPSAKSISPRFKNLKLGVVASLKKGMEQFIYREVCHMEKYGAQITLFPTKQGTGLYSPKSSWITIRWTLIGLLLAQPMVLLGQPIRYLKTLFHAIRHRAVGDFLLAALFTREFRQVDAIYCTFGDRKFFVGYFGKLLTNKPLLCTMHAYELYTNPNETLFRQALQSCDQVITVSQYNVDILQNQYGYPADQIEIITYSIDLDDYRPAEKFAVLIVGFFVPRKGHEVLFRAVKSLNNPNVEVWVVGGAGAESDAVDVPKLADDLGITDQVAFFGKQSGTALRALFHACDVFCLPCHFDDSGVGEGFPNVIIEAMATGKPVISSQHVGIPEILEETCVPEKDIQGVAVAINRLFLDSDARAKQGRRNRELAERHFSSHNVVRTLELAEKLGKKRGNA